MPRKIVEIEDWCIDGDCLLGMVKGHPKFGDSAEPVKTSAIKSLDRIAGIAQTRWTTYKLGTERKSNV